MATNFPAGLDDFSDPLSSTPLSGGGNSALTHSAQHKNLNDAVEAIEATIGVVNSTNPISIQYRLNNLAGSFSYTMTSANRILTPNECCIVNGSNITLTLPANPQNGDQVQVVLPPGFTGLVIGRNGNSIMGVNEDMTVDKVNVNLTFKWLTAISQWRIF